MKDIIIENAREHNLQGINLTIPRHRLTVVVGVSGSGKSSLVYNIIYAEAQRRYLETLAPFARQFLHLFQKPKVEWIAGLPPAIAVGQNPGSASSLSTVGTLSEIYDYLRLLFYSKAQQHCHRCGQPLQNMDPSRIATILEQRFAGEETQILAPLVRERKGNHRALLDVLERRGIRQVWVDGHIRTIAEVALHRQHKHTIAAFMGRFRFRHSRNKSRLKQLLKEALALNSREIVARSDSRIMPFSLDNYCPACQLAFPQPVPATFSFNSARYRCAHCRGRGEVAFIQPRALFLNPDDALIKLEVDVAEPSIRRALTRAWHHRLAELKPGPTMRWRDLSPSQRHMLLGETAEGAGRSPADVLLALFEDLPIAQRREWEMNLLGRIICPSCDGSRLGEAGRAFRLGDHRLGELCRMPLGDLRTWAENILSQTADETSRLLLQEISRRLDSLLHIGLEYLHLHRSSPSLSGGELQRLRLAARLQQDMGGVLYVLDEPSIGLHPADLQKLLGMLEELRDQDNTVLVVEHDERTIRQADYVIELGPGGGSRGGRVLFAGPQAALESARDSVIAPYLSGQKAIPLPVRRRRASSSGATIRHARRHNLKDLEVFFPFHVFTVVTGVSGSGKSSLVAETLYPLLWQRLHGGFRNGQAENVRIRGALHHVYFVDQSPVGRTPRSTPATYTGIFDDIRRFYARLPEAQARGFTPGSFSFNTARGRCPACQGLGVVRLEMKFLPDSYITCDQCQGSRYQWDLLRVHYQGKSISDVLQLSVDDALDLFRNFPSIRKKLQILSDTGMGYVGLGQPTPSLSGGEQQRLKLANRLLVQEEEHTLFILDEPTTGLHFAEIEKLCRLIHHLVDRKNTIIAIEHNPDFIRQADYIIDLGPGSGEQGGEVLYAGPLPGILDHERSLTGRFLGKNVNKD
ncbi:MAG: excinuclease ABC subunit UvrA [Acidobacteria bacterium]|nr:excinuclease ABC subunit UvrA [Acidobacteriota bacterium]